MKSDQKKNGIGKTKISKLKSIPAWLRLLISFLYAYSTTIIGAAFILLIIIAVIGDLFTMQGLILALIVIGFLILKSINKWFEDN